MAARGPTIVLVLIVASAAWLPTFEAQPERLPLAPGEVLGAAVVRLEDGGVAAPAERVVLVEDYTATWCPPCADSDAALTRLLDEHSPSLRAENASQEPARLALLQHHPWPDMGRVGADADPFGVPEGSDRMQEKYGAFWFPTAVFDGVLKDEPEPGNVSVSEGGADAKLARYRAMLAQRLAIPAAAQVTAVAGPGEVTVTIEPHAGVGARRLLAFVAVAEDHVPFAGGNGVTDHRMTVRAMLEPESWRGPGERTFTRSFDVGDTWNASRLVLVAWAEVEKPTLEAAAQADELFLFAVGSAAVLLVGLLLPARLGRRGGSK